MAKVKSRPQAYPAMSFHIVRAIAFISQTVVSGILIFFCIQLKKDGFKLPWTFIIVLAASILSILSLIITSFFYLCAFLSPLFNLIVNVTIIIIQFVGFVLLTWNMYGTLGHSCSRSNWASDDGMMVCRVYKAFYSFALFAFLAQIALIVLDVRSRRNQTKLGKYGNIEGATEVKMDKLGHSHQPSHASHASSDDVPYGIHDYRDQPTRPAYQGENASYYNSHPQVRMDDFSSYNNNAPPAAYGSGGYGYTGRR